MYALTALSPFFNENAADIRHLHGTRRPCCTNRNAISDMHGATVCYLNKCHREMLKMTHIPLKRTLHGDVFFA